MALLLNVPEFCMYRTDALLEGATVLYKPLLPSVTFLICEGPFSQPLLTQLRVIPKTRNKFVEEVTVAGRYFIITHVKIGNH